MSIKKVSEKKAKYLDKLLQHHLNFAIKFDEKTRTSFIEYLKNIDSSFPGEKNINNGLPEKEDIAIIIEELETY